MPPALGDTLRVLRPAPHIRAFYDGRVPGVRLHSAAPNWLDDGAYEAGIASYAVINAGSALIYDTNISLAHARLIRRTLEAEGVRHMIVVLSHWHDDHVAGTAAFADCEILASRRTAEILAEKRADLESGDPPIKPLILPTRTYEGECGLAVGALQVRLIQVDVHSCDATVVRLPDGILLAGDTLEDPVTYVDEPGRLAAHLVDLARMADWDITRILPNHGAEETIASGGYGKEFIYATMAYIKKLIEISGEVKVNCEDLRSFAAAAFATGAVTYFAPYEAVHRQNVAAVRRAAGWRDAD
ncbi:MBL fold metallo-hydrolase [Aquabacter spiritensis]|uniref:Glyoxylase-like metal-dependent hydrolase (Beta-lactamase superfamily II) n=1 Tax=Aquabacter spiritensis TaxID=933073 RepID=A0A4R3M0Q7_9HYPH|nr:MBL fold metallo-hydrolase [Aquabacter spiritensis]TCT04675.1 glyoxylase-like metal-dependent hydrolase (beta-lactamase superfamily II) [Aquabacter spiritensis]